MSKSFRIATFNANSIRVRIPIIQEWLSEHTPDILCIQETKVQDQEFPISAFSDLGYSTVFRGQKGYNGVALVSKETALQPRFGLDDGKDPDEARLLCAEVSGITIVNTYIPQGTETTSPNFTYKLEWFERLLNYFSRHFTPQTPLVWVGDLNVAPTPLDVHDPEALDGHVCFHPLEREAFQRILDWGFSDVFRLHHPDERVYSFWDYRVRGGLSRNQGWRLDHVLATRSLSDRSVGAFIDKAPRLKERPSDHTFVVAEFDWP